MSRQNALENETCEVDKPDEDLALDVEEVDGREGHLGPLCRLRRLSKKNLHPAAAELSRLSR